MLDSKTKSLKMKDKIYKVWLLTLTDLTVYVTGRQKLSYPENNHTDAKFD